MPKAYRQHHMPALRPQSDAVTFGSFRIDLRASQLFDGAQPVPLRPKTWAVLLYLASRPSELVTRDEILDAVWPDVAVTPDTLNKSIGELRLALGDDSRTPRFLETVHRRGFRFIAALRQAATATVTPPVDTDANGGPLEVRETTPDCFVGRDAELRFLVERFAAAQAGEQQIVFVTGQAGIGKTSLVDAFLGSRAVGERRGPVWIGRATCIEQHAPQEPYMPVLDALQRLVRPPNVERMIALLRRAAPLWLAQMPWLLGEADAAALRQSLQGARPERMPRELAALLETLTADLTLILVLEDLHWSDPSTVDLLTLLAQRRDRARLLVIGTYRAADVAAREHVLGGAVRALREHGRCHELALADLDEPAVHRYLELRFPAHRFPLALAQRLHTHTDGQPLFVVALTDHLVARGAVLDTDPGWALSMPLDAIDLGVPDDVRRLLEGEFRSLSPSERSVLEAASAAGEPIVAAILAAALGSAPDLVEQHCETLARAQHFLQIAGTHEWPDGTRARRYAFTHALHRQVVYDETPDERRARLHGAIGRALERAQGEHVYDLAPQLASHFALAHDHPRTLLYLTVAGRRARDRFASREAREYLERALALVGDLDDPDERRRRETDVRLALGRALGDLHGFGAEAVRENYERVSELCAVTGQASHAFEALYARWYVHALRAERTPTLALAAELAEIAAGLESPGYLVLADSILVRAAYYDARFADAERHMAGLRAHLAEHPSGTMPIAYGVDPVLAATTHCAASLWLMGDAESAATMMHDAVAAARASRNPFFLAAMLTQAAQLAVMIGYDESGGALAAEAEALAVSQGFALWQAMAAAMKARAQAQRGDAAGGRRGIARALEAIGATGTRLSFDLLHAFLAEAHLHAGARADGLAALEAGLGFAATTLNRGYEPELWRLKGELLLVQPTAAAHGRKRSGANASVEAAWPEAERCLQHALQLARASEARSLELRAALSLGRAWDSRGRRKEARRLLGDICSRFPAASSPPDLVAARALRDAMRAAR